MPILVKDYEWRETKEKMFVTVPLKGVKGSNVDLLCTDEFLKASYPPFLFEVLLHGKIDDSQSSAKIRDGCIQFDLAKRDLGMWTRLLSENSDDKAFVLKKKKEAVEYAQAKAEEEQKEKESKRTESKKYAMKEMMRLEAEDKTRIQSVKDKERKRTEEEMERWKKKRQEEEEEEKRRLMEKKIEQSLEEIGERKNEENFNGQEDGARKQTKEIFGDKVVENIVDVSNNENVPNERISKPRGSKPRECGKISFKFTPRVFPTPLRESKTAEEDEWLRNQAEARKITDVEDADLRDHEKDPVWLKDKGNSLFASGNFLAAVNAYNLALRMQQKNHTLYLNRSACHLKVRNFFKCIEDCTAALDLLQPPVPANANARLKAHIRKGAALCELEMYAEGLMDYMAALKIDPNNEALQRNAQNIREIIEKGDTGTESGAIRE